MSILQTLHLNKPERRKFPRLAQEFPISAAVITGENAGSEIEGRALNVSKEGMKVSLPMDMTVGDQISIVLEGDDDSSICLGRVIWKSNEINSRCYGLKITSWSYIELNLYYNLNTLQNIQEQ